MLLLALACSFIAFAATGLLSRYARRQGLSYPEAMPQRFHRGAVPRRSHAPYGTLDRATRRRIKRLAALLVAFPLLFP